VHELLEVRRAAERSTVTGRAEATERDPRIVVDRLIADVNETCMEALRDRAPVLGELVKTPLERP